MKRLWVNVGPIGSQDLVAVAASGAAGIRCTYAPINVGGGRAWLAHARSLGLQVLMVLDNDAHWWDRPDPWYEGCVRAYDAYADLVDYWQVLNEPDAGWEPTERKSAAERSADHPSSWCLDPGDVTARIKAARKAMQRDTVILGPGLSSGHAEYARLVDWGAVNAIAIHPYAKQAGSPELNAMIVDYQTLGLPVWVSEYDARTPTMHAAMSADERIVQAAVYCWSDAQNQGFGLVDEQGQAKPTYHAFAAANAAADVSLEDPPVPEPTPPTYQFGFRDLADRLGSAVVGDPVELEHVGTIQKTTRGWMIYHPDTGELAFVARPGAAHETPVAGQQTALGDLWGAVVTVPFNVDAAIVKTWLDSPLAYGSPLGPERPIDGGGVEQAFTRALIRWTPADGVSVQTA